MKETTGNAMVFTLIITFIIILIAFLAGSLSYSKAFKVKNLIVDIIEEHHGWDNEAHDEIEQALTEIGYRVNQNGMQSCPNTGGTIVNQASNYRYCVERFDNKKGFYYRVVAYMYFDIPIIGQTLELPVSAETKIIYVIE